MDFPTTVTAMDNSRLRVTSAIAWIAGGGLWTLAGLVAGGSMEVLWIPADLLLFFALITTARLGLHERTKTGRAGLLIAVVGRVIFVLAEVLSVIQDKEQNALLPAAALLSAIGITLYGVGVLRAHRWSGHGRFIPLVAGLYPFAVMFPIVVASRGNPSETAIAFWGLPLAAVGAALWLNSSRPLRAGRRDARLSA